MRHSEQFGQVAAALAKAQAAINQPAKNKTATVQTRTGGSYKFAYADLSAMIEAAHKALGEAGLAFVCCPALDQDGTDILDARVIHESGQWLGASFPLKLDGTPQECGSAITYGRRYCLMMLCNMAADDDDDGNGASGNTASIGDRRPPVNGKPHNGGPSNGAPPSRFANSNGNGGAGHNGQPSNGAPSNGAPSNGGITPPSQNMEKMAGALGVNADGTISDEQISVACNEYRRRNGVDASEVRAVIKSVTGCDRVRDVPQEKRKGLMNALAKTIAPPPPKQADQPAGAAA